MNVLYNGLCIGGKLSGVQYYAEHLLLEALNDCDKGFNFNALLLKEAYARIKNASSGIFVDKNNKFCRIMYEHTRLQKEFTKGLHDILHCPAYILPYNFRGRSVLTVHDTIALHNPEYCSTANALYYNLLLKRSIKKATKIIAVSNCVKNDILTHTDIDPAKIHVIYHGIDSCFSPVKDGQQLKKIKDKYRLPDNFILYVGNIEPKKNLTRLLQAYGLLCRQPGFEYRLIIVGQTAWKYKNVFKESLNPEINRGVKFLDYVNREDLPCIYSLAKLFVFPSLYEGFGFPPLESMACGTPAIVSDAGSLPEITDRKALCADPYSVENIASLIEKGLTDTKWRKNAIREGLAHARNLQWEHCWNNTKHLYYNIL